MAITINDNIQVNAGKPTDNKYLNSSNATYTGVTEVNSRISVPERHIGLTVNVNNEEYWYATGVTNSDLVVKNIGEEIQANNGLTKLNGVVSLGGVLTGNTVISGNSNNFNITGLTTLDLSATNINLTGIVTLQTTPTTGSTSTDSVLVWDPSDNQIKQISPDNLGEDNNNYAVTAITSSTVNLTGDEYVVLLDTTTTGVTVTLSTSPIIGEAVKIKDKSGNALTNNITIDSGSGNTIDGSQCAVINTDYGGVELVYGDANSWYALSYIT